jgi:hypothetical protein
MVVQVCNPSYSEGGDRRLAQAKVRPYLKNKLVGQSTPVISAVWEVEVGGL